MKPSEEPNLFTPNIYALEQEWQEQPNHYRKYARKLADARRDLEQAKADLDVTKAEIDLDIRRNPAKLGIDKPTEPAIKAYVTSHKKVRQASQTVIDAKHRVDVLEANVTALEHKKKALEKEVDLFLAGYFAKPRSPKGMNRTETDMALRKGIKHGNN